MHIYIYKLHTITITLTPAQFYKMTDAMSAKGETGRTDRPTTVVVPTARTVDIAEASDHDQSSYIVDVVDVIPKPNIQRVPKPLLRNNAIRREFEPEAVAIGPFHSAKKHLKPTQELKREAAKYVVERSTYSLDRFKDKVRDLSGEAREYYVGDMPAGLGDEEFENMLFYDGCFILQFVDLFLENRLHKMKWYTRLHRSIMRDMFLLENQLPLFVLAALMNFMPVDLEEFIDRVIGNPPARMYSYHLRGRVIGEEEGMDKSFHLLDLLRSRLLGPEGKEKEKAKSIAKRKKVSMVPSAASLKEVGIIFRTSTTRHLRDVKFKKGLVRSSVRVPRLVVDHYTRSRFLNLIALEACAHSLPDNGITSYVWLMHHFIDHAEDVKELRSRRVLLNAFGSDQQVADLFGELGRDLPPHDQDYYGLALGITGHCNNCWRVSTGSMLHTHFSSPWTAIAFFAGVLLTVLSVIQTIFTVWPRK